VVVVVALAVWVAVAELTEALVVLVVWEVLVAVLELSDALAPVTVCVALEPQPVTDIASSPEIASQRHLLIHTRISAGVSATRKDGGPGHRWRHRRGISWRAAGGLSSWPVGPLAVEWLVPAVVSRVV
jgi:hypothetical protein